MILFLPSIVCRKSSIFRSRCFKAF